MLFFFFKQKTAYDMRISDWSSDVCSSDLANEELFLQTLPSGMNETAAPAKTFDNIALHELQYALQKATAALTPQQKQVFEMSRIEGLKHKEIALKLGVSQNTVKKHIADALRTIRFEMQSYNRFVHLAILQIERAHV